MTTLAEFLQANEKKIRDDEKLRESRRGDWVAAVERLLAQVEQWLREADPKGLLQVERTVYERRESGLGFYKVPGLIIRFGQARVEVSPWARNVFGLIVLEESHAEHRIEGAVHLTDGGEKIILYRLIRGGQDEWRMARDADPNTTLLTRERFEAAFLRLIK